MNKKSMVGTLTLALSMPLLMVAFAAPGATAAGITSDVQTVDSCKWEMGIAPTSIAMVTEGGALFRGDAISISATITAPMLALSGTSTSAVAGPSTECSFYNNVINQKVTITLDGTLFDATYGAGAGTGDPAMDFSIGTAATRANPLVLTPSMTDSCSADGWSATPLSLTAIGASDLHAFSNTTDVYADAAAPRCAPSTIVSIEVPATSAAPLGAGLTYNFSGPTITFAKATN